MLRAAVKEGADSIDRGEGIAFESMDDLAAYIQHAKEDVFAEVAAGRKLA